MTLVLFLILYPYFEEGTASTGVPFGVIVLLTHLSAVYAVSRNRRTLIVGPILMGPALLGALKHVMGIQVIHPTWGMADIPLLQLRDADHPRLRRGEAAD